jgi:hypothetical protein
MKTVNIKGKEYVEVNERLKYFRQNFKNYSLESEIINLTDGVVTIKAIIKDENGRIIATGLAQEKESSSFINKTSFVENCETSAWGRALGNLGIGIDTSVATADEVQNAINNQNMTDNDIDIIEGLKAADNIKNLNAYFNNYKSKVIDLKKFQQAYTTKATQLKKEVQND